MTRKSYNLEQARQLTATYQHDAEELLTQLGLTTEDVAFDDLETITLSYEASTKAPTLEGYKLLEPASKLAIPKDFQEKVASIGDDDPMYVTWAIPSGFSRYLDEESISGDAKPSKKNRHRWWSEDVIWSFAEQVRKRRPVGYAGHANMFSFNEVPAEIPVQWIAASKARREKDNLAVTIVRGYVYPFGNTRAYIKTDAINSGSVATVGTSEWGDAPDGTKDVELIQSAQLMSFDLVRKGTHGIPGTKIISKESAMPRRKGVPGIKQEVIELDAAGIELVRGLNEETLATYNPTLHEQLTASEESADVSDLVRRLDETAQRAASDRADAEIARRLAENLKCKVGDLPSVLAERQQAHEQSIQDTIESTVANYKGSDKMKAFLKEQLKQRSFGSPGEVKPAAEQIAQGIRDAAALLDEEARGHGSAYSRGRRHGGKIEANEEATSGGNSFISEGIRLMQTGGRREDNE